MRKQKLTYEAPTDAGTPAAGPLAAVVKRTKPKATKKKKAAKPKAKKALPKKAAKSKPKAKKAPVKKKSTAKPSPKKKTAAVAERTERLDFRLPKKLKAKLLGKAKASRRTVTSVVQELIERMK
jgi:hypothetical protein